jgi:hypothetical protein
MHPTGLLQPLSIPEWKWETISMDLITGLTKSTNQNDVIMVVVDKLSKDDHFIPVKSTCKAIYIVNIFMKEIFRLHGMGKSYHIEKHNLLQIFGNICLLALKLNCYSVQHITLKLMGRQRE